MLKLIKNHENLKEYHKYFIINKHRCERFIGTFHEEKKALTNVTVLECKHSDYLRRVYYNDGYIGILSDDIVYEYEDETDIVVEMI